jgi:ATP-dependent Clp protease ATP-binding subunit ClpC
VREPIALDIVAGEERAGQRDASTMGEVAQMRRWAHSKLELPTVEEVRERIVYLTAELAYGTTKKGKERDAPAGQQQVELARAQDAMRKFEEARGQLDSIEELGLAAYLAGETTHVLGEDAEIADGAVREALLHVLMALVARNRITLVVQEHDRHRPLDRWLGGLLDVAKSREWSIHAHLFDNGYGDSVDATALSAALHANGRGLMTAVLRVQGPDAGTLLALEAGLHRVVEPAFEPDVSTFAVRAIAQRSALTEQDLRHPLLAPLAPLPQAQLRLLPAAREVYGDRVTIDHRRATVAMERDAYWAEHWRIALEQLLLFEERPEDRAALFASPLDVPVQAP